MAPRAEIADAIAAALGERGLDAVVAQPDQVESVIGFDAVIIGSGVYAGHWLEPAKRLIERETGALLARRVWLFSSGPLGDDGRRPIRPTSRRWSAGPGAWPSTVRRPSRTARIWVRRPRDRARREGTVWRLPRLAGHRRMGPEIADELRPMSVAS